MTNENHNSTNLADGDQPNRDPTVNQANLVGPDSKTDSSQDELVIISANPKSGSGQGRNRIEQLKVILEQAGLEVFVTTQLDEVAEKVQQSIGKNLKAVVAAGGDGTIGLLVNSLPKETPFSVLPLGTENLLSKYLGFDGSAGSTARTILEGQPFELDAGQANGKTFLVMTSCGFDADVVARMHKIRTGHIGRLSYLGPIFNSIRFYRFPNLEITIDGVKFSQPAAWALVFNFPQYAMNLPIITKGNATDGLLHLRTFRKGGVLRGIRYFLSVLFRQHEKWSEAQYLSAKEIKIESKGKEVPFQIDGDPGGVLPLKISISSKRIKMLLTDEMKKKIEG